MLQWLSKIVLGSITKKTIKTLVTDPYEENMWAFISSSRRFGPQLVLENNLRAQEGITILRPFGSPKNFPDLSKLMFNIAQLHIMPTNLSEPVDLKVTIGKKTSQPLILQLPVMVSAMAYGKALSENVKVALAKGAAAAGTASNTGEGPFLPSERKASKQLILQYNRAQWNKSDETLKQGDAIEIQFGQGASAGIGNIIESKKIDSKLRHAFGIGKGEAAVTESRQSKINHPSDLVSLVSNLRELAGDIPIGVKFGAGKHMEKDMEWAVKAGVDFISIDGAEAATKGSPPILQDDFGVPLVFAIVRAAEFIRQNKIKDKVSLIVSGGIRTPGEMLKALALGADAVNIGTAALFALAHTQVLKTLPFEPPSQLVYYTGENADEFDVKKGAESLAKFLFSCKAELSEGVRALGKTSISEVNKDDLFALDDFIAKATGVKPVYEP